VWLFSFYKTNDDQRSLHVTRVKVVMILICGWGRSRIVTPCVLISFKNSYEKQGGSIVLIDDSSLVPCNKGVHVRTMVNVVLGEIILM
jgi:hypothetical protein